MSTNLCRTPNALEFDVMADELKDIRVPVMMTATEVAAIDAWRRKQEDLPSRSEAVRRLVELGLKADTKALALNAVDPPRPSPSTEADAAMDLRRMGRRRVLVFCGNDRCRTRPSSTPIGGRMK